VARTVQVHLLDDIDGSAADETIRFSLDGISYEIDLSSAHASKLRDSLGSFVASSRRLGRDGTTAAVRRRGGVTPARTDREQNLAIRAWAKRKKIKLSDRGRIPRTVVEQYESQAGR
jgi:hypothetical protein